MNAEPTTEVVSGGDGWPPLWPAHREFLQRRGVAPAVAKSRGYYSTESGPWLPPGRPPGAGVGNALVIPVWDLHGKRRFEQYRPDHPGPGRPKYEIAARTRLVVDVPPSALGRLDDPAIPLIITESPVKADAAVSAGLVAVATIGVYSFRGERSRKGDKAALRDWEWIPVSGRTVYLVPDSDVATNPNVATAVWRLGVNVLGFKDANVRYVTLPDAADGSKQGLDDWLVSDYGGIDPVRALAALAADDPPDRAEDRRSRRKREHDSARAKAAASLRATDIGYARRLLDAHGDDMRYVAKWKTWLTWDGQRWAVDDTGQVYDWAAALAERVTDAIDPLDREGRGAAERRERAVAIRGSMEVAAADRAVAILPSALDSDPFALNVANGTLDLRTMTLGEHRREHLITKITRGGYVPGAHSDDWADFLKQVQPDEDIRAYLARLTGLSLEGRVIEHVLPVHYGKGGNGKTTFFEACAWALGDYAMSVDVELLLERHNQSHPTAIADLFGARLVIAREAEANRRLAEATVKWLTGGDQITARRLYQDNFTFTPSHTFALFTNNKPRITQQDHGIWRRLRLVPWQYQIPHEDGQLPERLRAAADAVLAWLIAGYADWADNTLAEPGKVKTATDGWKRESDDVARFLALRCVRSSRATVLTDELYREWDKWCQGERLTAGTPRLFTGDVARLGDEGGWERWKDRDGNRGFKGLGLLAEGTAPDVDESDESAEADYWWGGRD